MSQNIDVEQGIPEEEDHLEPLLDQDGRPQLSTRPSNISLSDLRNHPRFLNLSSLTMASSSCPSTVNNTPVAEGAEGLPRKWRRSDRRLRRLNTELLTAIEENEVEEVERLLKAGANPNATCRRDMVSACHVAALLGGDALSLLVKFGAEKNRQDRLGRTPLHLAAYAGNARQMAILLDFPEDMHDRVDSDSMSSEAEEDVKKLCEKTKAMANVRCDVGEVKTILPSTWKDNIDHNCRSIEGSFPLLQPGWTPLHVAASCARRHCTRLLLAAGADPNINDEIGRTPLDVAGSGYCVDMPIDSTNFTEVLRLILKAGGENNSMKTGQSRLNNITTPLHTAVELENIDAIRELLQIGASIACLNTCGQTPLHVCVKKELEDPLKVICIKTSLINHMHDRVDSDSMSSEAEEDVKKLCEKTKAMANVRCDVGEVKTILPSTWKDNIDHNCRSIEGSFPLLQPGWTPLHVAASCARRHCTRLLLAAGADPNINDEMGRTPLDVAGSGYCVDMPIDSTNFTEVLRLILKAGGENNSMKTGQSRLNNITTPLHTAVELENIDAIRELLQIGASIACLNTCGQTPLHVCVKKELEDPLKILANEGRNDSDPLSAVVDVKDREGHTVLQAAIEAPWVRGVCVALEAGADVTLKANDGETPIHSAAALGNLDVLNEILSVAKQKDSIDYQNEEGETALFKAIKHGNLDCVKLILEEGASIKITLPGDVNVFHVAAEYGNKDILEFLIDYDEAVTQAMINSLTAGDRKGYGPLHFAVSENHRECVELMLRKNADIRLRTTSSPHKSSTPLHIAAVKNRHDVAVVLLSFDKTIIHEVNCMGWFPIHSASHHGSRDVIVLLLREGANLAGYTDGPKKFRRTAIDMIANNLSKPTEFLEEVLDSYIKTNDHNLQDANCEVIIDYRILMPSECEMEQMKVIEALLKTGNRYGQKRLLLHPLIESFLYLKWKALLPFFYTIIALYALFLMSLTIFAVSLFFYKDTMEEKPIWLDAAAWGYVVYASICLILLQELLYMNVKSSRYFLQLETWVKFGSIGLAIILPPAVMVPAFADAEWPRHVATIALLLAWLEMMFLLSRFPNWGYYVLMFGKVASNVIKILLTFAFLVIGFSFSFMIQFRSKTPFEGPWAAFVKTVVMMTSEFEYSALFDEAHSKELAFSFQIVRLIFVAFLILAAIVLMNLMVGVAVNDINDLEILGNIRRLDKQVEFLSTLDTLVYNRVFTKILPRRANIKIKNKRNVRNIVILRPGRPRWRYYKILPSRIRDELFNKAQSQKKQREDELDLIAFKGLLQEIRTAVVKNEDVDKAEVVKSIEDRPIRNQKRHEEVMKRLNSLDGDMAGMKEQIDNFTEHSKSPIEALNVKVDKMSLEMEEIKQFLVRLESKLSKL